MAKFNPFLEPSFAVPDNLKKLPLRAVKIPDGGTLNVPSFIRRVDIQGYRKTHGWQVYYKKPFKFFSDGSKKPSESVLVAAGYFSSIYRGN